MENFDLIVVGGGKAGKSLAMNRAKKGWKVALIERQFIGGTCINVACIPTKSLVAAARRMEDTRSDATFGIEGTAGAYINVEKLRAHKEGIVSAMVAAHEKFFAAPGIDFIVFWTRTALKSSLKMEHSANSIPIVSCSIWEPAPHILQFPDFGKLEHGIARISCEWKKFPHPLSSLAADTSASNLHP